MSTSPHRASTDWAGNVRAYAIAWGLPSFAIIAGAFFDSPGRAVIWSLALAWMGIAFLLNARRCGRTHCRYTGPFYLLLIVPVGLLALEVIPLGAPAWWTLGAIILFGGKIIWWFTESAWGKYVN